MPAQCQSEFNDFLTVWKFKVSQLCYTKDGNGSITNYLDLRSLWLSDLYKPQNIYLY